MHALTGITVVSLEQAVAAPFATRQLADLGARVIKVERPRVGDFARGYDRTVHGESSYFVWLNRGKESVELNIKDPADRSVLDRMLARADVFVQNLVPGAVERLGLDAPTLRERRPDLIHCSISGYGSTGPYRNKKAYDLLVQCESGLVDITGTPAHAAKVGISVADIATGMYAFGGILAALFERTRTGIGSALEVGMLDALGEWMMQPTYYSVYGERPNQRTGTRHASIAPYGPYAVGDGSTIFFGIQNDREWATFCRDVIGRPDLVTHESFSRNPERVAHNAQLTDIIEVAFASKSGDVVIADLEAAKIACARLRTTRGFFEHPQLSARDRWRTVATPGGSVQALLPPVTLPGREAVMGSVPSLGQHNEGLLAEFGPDEIGLLSDNPLKDD